MPSYDKPPRVTDILKNLSREQRRMAANRRVENAQITQGGITIVDPLGNVVGKIGELDDGTTGIATASGSLDSIIEQTNTDVQAARDAAAAAQAAGDNALSVGQAAQSAADDANAAAAQANATAAQLNTDLDAVEAALPSKADKSYADTIKATADAAKAAGDDAIAKANTNTTNITSINNLLPSKADTSYVQSRGTDLVANGTGFLGNNYNFSNFTFSATDAPRGSSGSFVNALNSSSLFTDEAMPISIDKTYILSAWVRQTVPGIASRFFLGLAALDVVGNSISPQNYAYYPQSMTTLAADLKPGDTTVTLTDGSNWRTSADSSALRYVGVWNYVDSKGKKWAPGTYTRQNALFASRSGNVLTLSAPWPSYLGTQPAGTAVSNNIAGGSYMYTTAVNEIAQESWTQYTSAIIGGAHDGATTAAATTKFPPGTASVQVVFLVNRDVAGGAQAFAGISLSDASAAATRAETAALAAGTAQTRADDAYSLATTGKNTADTALATANGKNKVTHSVNTPGATANTAGDIWFQYDNATGVIIGQWQGAGGTAWTTRTLGSSVIANLDAGKITTGTLDAARIAANSITVGQIKPVLGAYTKIFRDVYHGQQPTVNLAGSIIIHTPITFSNKMIRIDITGYNFSANSEIDLTITGYAQSSGSFSSAYGGVTTRGKAQVTARVGRAVKNGTTYSTDDTIDIILDIQGGVWQYPTIQVDRFEASYSTIAPDEWSSGWSAEFGVTTLPDYPTLASFIARDLQDSNLLTQGWRTTGTTTIDGGKITADSVAALQIKANAITAGKIDADAVDSREIKANAIGATEIAALAIAAGHLAADSVVAGKIAANAVGAREIIANSITAAQIAASTITATQIAANTITTANIAALQITSALLAADSVVAGKVAALAIGTRELQADSVTAAKIKAGEVTAGKLAAGAVVAGNIAAGTIVAADIAGSTITGDKIAGATITGDKLVANTISADKINGNTFTGNTFTGGTFVGGIIRTAATGGIVLAGGTASPYLTAYHASNGTTTTLDTEGMWFKAGSETQMKLDATNGLVFNSYAGGGPAPTMSLHPTRGLWLYDATGANRVILNGEQATFKNGAGATQFAINSPTDGASGVAAQATRAMIIGSTDGTKSGLYGGDYIQIQDKPYFTTPTSYLNFQVGRAYPQERIGFQNALAFYYGNTQMFTIQSNGNVFNGDIFQNKAPQTTTYAANLHWSSGNNMIYQSSSMGYNKLFQEEIPLSDAEKVLTLTPKTWIDRGEYREDPTVTDRVPGLVAEEVLAASDACDGVLQPLITTTNSGGVAAIGIAYDRIPAYLIPIIRDLRARVETLETQLSKVTS